MDDETRRHLRDEIDARVRAITEKPPRKQAGEARETQLTIVWDGSVDSGEALVRSRELATSLSVQAGVAAARIVIVA